MFVPASVRPNRQAGTFFTPAVSLPKIMKCIRRSLAAACLAATSASAALDLNTDTVPDVWALVYNVGAIDMAADSDGDGLSNAKEAIAGTDPFSPANTVRITTLVNDVYGVHLGFAANAGKRYQVQSTASLSSPSWANEGNALAGIDGNLTADVGTAGAGNKFYRIVVSDLDSDGDGVSDWEEIKLGLDPNSTHSNGSNGSNDLENATQALTAPSVVIVTAVDNEATEPASGVTATDTAAFVISRTGGLKPISVQFNTTGSAATSGTDYTALASSAALGLGVKSVTVPVTPLSDSVTESPEGILLNAVAGSGYTLGSPTTAAVIIQDRTAANGNGLRARFWNEATTLSPTNPAIFPGNPVVTRIDPIVDYTWPDNTTQGSGSPAAGVTTNYFSSRWTGEVLPEFSQIYTFQFQVNLAGRVWVGGNLLINNWPPAAGVVSGTFSGTIELQAGVRYPIVVEQYETTGSCEAHLRWSSANQPLQVIPTARLFADTAPQILGPLQVLLIEGSGPYAYQIQASGSPTAYSAANLPPGWSVNAVTGLISGNANTAGEWEVPLMATNSVGSGSAILKIKVLDTGGAITRDLWSGVPGTAVSAIPLSTNPTSSANVGSLEGPLNDADNYGARIRGYVTAPATGAYKFFLAASNAAELWISNDDEPVNSFKRAEVITGTGHREWAHANADSTPLLWLDAGKRYFVEIRHKAGVGADHVSVGWLKPGEGGANPDGATAPTEVVPGFVLSPYVPPAPISGESTLYVASLTAQGSAQTSGFGSATLRLSADETQAILTYTYGNLTTPVTQKHIHSDAFATHSQGEIIFDIDVATPNADGSYTWDLSPTGTFTTRQQILDAIKQGHAYLNVHTATYPAGEIRGNFRLAAASQTFTPPAPQPWSDPESAASPESHLNRNAASRFLVQATFGVSGADANLNGNPDDIESVQALGFEGWINDQFTKAPSYHFPYVFGDRNQTSPNNATYPGTLLFSTWWKNSITGQDQLRQRVAFALSEILVTSEAGILDERADALSDYYDMLLDNSFGNFKDMLVATTLHPAMGRYLDMLGNRKPNLSTGRIPNENYAREILQLFSIGLNRMHPDGSLILNSKGELVPTYGQEEIIGFAHAFTGWYYHVNVVPPAFFPTSMNAGANWIDPMTEVPQEHFTGQKRILNNVVLPGLPVLPSMGNQVLNPFATHTSGQIQTPEYQALPAAELEATHDAIFQNPNTGPFICRQLIQRLVTSTPSRGYIYRVVSKFNDNGSGVRGDMKAVIKAILLDYEARSAIASAGQGFGKQREPVSRITAIARAFPSPANIAGTYTQSGTTISVTTATPHLYAAGNSIYLDFNPSTSGDPGQPADATYTTLTTPFSTTSFTVRPKSFEGPMNYTRANGITRFEDPNNGTDIFAYTVGESIFIEYLTGTPSAPASGIDTVEFRTSDEEDIIVANPTTKRGTYSQPAGNSTLTVTMNAHGYTAGSQIHLEFVNGAAPATQIYTIATVPTANTFTITLAAPATARTNLVVFATPPADLVATTTGTANLCRAADTGNRSGTLAVTYSDWNMSTTDTDLNQTPMRSPTVFNFFLPDYQFPGILANAGLITPEFELTAETSVIRQANFIYNGLFTTALGQTGVESFKSGGRDIIVDLRRWMANGPGGLPWVHNNNLSAFIDELNTRLMGGQLPPAAKTLIQNYAATLAYTTPTPTSAQLRDRVRTVVHLIVTSPDFTIQK
jgi:uncharacterized protein (DUF1800 family)